MGITHYSDIYPLRNGVYISTNKRVSVIMKSMDEEFSGTRNWYFTCSYLARHWTVRERVKAEKCKV